MKPARLLLLSLVLLLQAMALFAQKTGQPAPTGYNIKVKLTGLKDTVVYLANYYADKNTLRDTAKVDAQGTAVFEGKDSLEGGIYLVVLPSKKYFEVIINKEKHFSMETDTLAMVKNMKVKGSKENELFYEYLNYIEQKHNEVVPLQEKLKKTTAKDSTDAIRKQIGVIDKAVKEYKLDFIRKHPETFVAKIFKAMQEPEVPEAPKLANGKTDSTFAYRWYKAHFFDNIDFSDERLIRTPIIHNKVKQYMEQLTLQHPDSVIKSADVVVNLARANKEMFKYAVYWITYTYESSKIMGMDAVFVHMGKNYYTKDKAYWVTPEQLKKIQDKVTVTEPLLLNRKVPNLVMPDTTGKIQVLHNVKAKYTVLYFWDHGCSHCKKETPKLHDYYKKVKSMGVEVYSVETEQDAKAWKDYIREHKLSWINVQDTYYQTGFKKTFDIYTTPVIYLLDENKKIIAKKVDVENLENILNKKLGLETKEKKEPEKKGTH